MGLVYRAEDTKLRRPVALKFLRSNLLGSDDVKARFEREARAAAALQHPNVVEIPRREAEDVVETVLRSMVQALRVGDKVEIRGFGRFDSRQRAGRIGRNPKTGETVEVPAKRIPFFKPAKRGAGVDQQDTA